MKNTKAMSAVVTTVILVALTLIAVGVIWTVISGIVTDRSDNVKTQSSCLDVNLEVMSTDCAEAKPTTDPVTYNCTTTTELKAGDTIKGFKITYKDADDMNVESREYGVSVIDVSKTIKVLQTDTNETIGLVSRPISVEVSAYITNAAGEKEVCDRMATKKIPAEVTA